MEAARVQGTKDTLGSQFCSVAVMQNSSYAHCHGVAIEENCKLASKTETLAIGRNLYRFDKLFILNHAAQVKKQKSSLLLDKFFPSCFC
jgi:hypothetical protein